MKIKTAVISLCAGAALVGGGVLAAKRVAVSSRKAVDVMPVVNADLAIQYASWGFDSEDSMYGTIVSKDTQKVDLSIGDGQTLKDVCVSEGDTVKTGDVLLEYDVRKKELEREAHDLALQLSRLELKKLEYEVEELRSKYPALFADLEVEEKTASADVASGTGKESKGFLIDSLSQLDGEVEEETEGEESLTELDEDILLLDDSDLVVSDLADGFSVEDTAADDLPADGFAVSGSPAGTILSDGIPAEEDAEESLLSDDLSDEDSTEGADLADGILEEAASVEGTSLVDGILAQEDSAGGTSLVDGILAQEDSAGDTSLVDGILAQEGSAGGTSLVDGISVQEAAEETLLADGLIEEETAGDTTLQEGISAEEPAGEDLLAEDLVEEESEFPGDIITGGDGTDTTLPEGISAEEASAEAEEAVEVEEAEEAEELAVVEDAEDGVIEETEELEETELDSETETNSTSGSDSTNSITDQAMEEALNISVGQADDADASDGSSSSQGGNGKSDLSGSGEELEDNLLTFLQLVNLLTRQYTADPTSLKGDDLDQARLIYLNYLSLEKKISPFLDAFGEQRSVSLYVPGTELLTALQEMEDKYGDFSASDTLKALHQAYANYLYYRLVYEVQQTKTLIGEDLKKITSEDAENAEAQIRAAADAYYELYFFWRYLSESVPKLAQSSSLYQTLPELYLDELKEELLAFAAGDGDTVSDELFASYPILGRGYSSYLSVLVDLLLGNDLLEEEELEIETEDLTEDFDYGDDYDDETVSDEDLRSDFTEKLLAVRSQRVTVRQAELDLKKDDEEIEKATVRAALDGVVRSAGTLDEGTHSEEAFIVVAGEMGMYAVGSISEMERDSISLGDVVTGVSEETGQEFTATITEILDYPTVNDDDFYSYSYSSEITNSNASQYQFYAYIEDAEGLEEGYATLQFKKDTEQTTGIMLEDYFVKEEEDGSTYVYIRGENGQIKKQYVTVGKGSLFGSGKNITEGLEYEDMIAFPADTIREGDPTSEVEFLEDIYY